MAGANSPLVSGGFENWRVTNPDSSEIVRQRLYDFQLYPAAGVAQLTFFANPPGQGVTTAVGGVVGSAKTQWDTNIDMANTLPSGKEYLIESIEILFLPGLSAVANTYTPAVIGIFNAVAAAALFNPNNDVNAFYQSGMVELNILGKNYLRETPAIAFPPKCQLDVSGAVASNSATTSVVGTQLTKCVGRPYYLEPKIALQSAVNFEVLIKYPAAVAMPSGFNGRVGVIFDGLLKRASQ